MGGYVSLVAAEQVQVEAIFLLAPALYIPGYGNQEYTARNQSIEIVHGWSDDIIPPEHSIRFAREANCSLHLIPGDHRLNSSIEAVSVLFDQFLHTTVKNLNRAD
jgi:predicted esterase